MICRVVGDWDVITWLGEIKIKDIWKNWNVGSSNIRTVNYGDQLFWCGFHSGEDS
jgi:hypothetical protein